MANNELLTIIPTITAIRDSGNEQFDNKKYDEAIMLYENGLNYSTSFVYKNKGKISKEDVNEINLLKKEMLSKIAQCFFNLNEYEKSIEIDKGIISIDACYDEAYSRLFYANMKLNLPYVAVEYGNNIFKHCDDSIKEKYKDIKEQVERIEKERKEKQDKEFKEKYNDKLYKMILPMLVGAIAGAIFYFYKK